MVRRTKAQAMETRLKIIESAERAFSIRGVARTTLADIAELAGVTRGAIYWHFQSKEALFNAVLHSLTDPLEQALKRAVVAEQDTLGVLKHFLVSLFKSFVENPRARRLHEIVLHKCELTDELCDVRHQRQRVSERWDKHLEDLFQGAKANGQLHQDLDTRMAAITTHAFIEGHIGLWLLQPDSFSISESAERLIDSLLDMLRSSTALRVVVN